MIQVLIFIFCLLFIILASRRLEWAVMFLIAALPSYLIRFKIFGIPFTLLEVMLLIVFAAWLIANKNELKTNLANLFKRGGDKKRTYPFRFEISLLLIISFVSVGVSDFSTTAMGIWKAYFFEPALLYIVLFNMLANKNIANNSTESFEKKIILWPLLVSALAVSLFAIYQKITGQFIDNPAWAAEGTRRVVSFFGYPNAVGLYLGPIILIFAGWLASVIASPPAGRAGSDEKERQSNLENKIFKLKIFKTILIGVTIILSLISIYFARSEGALIGIGVGLILFGLLAGKRMRLATIGLVIAVTIGIAAFEPARDYAIKKITLNDFSGQVRRLQWAETWNMLSDGCSLTGAGLANYQNAIKPYHQEGFFYNRDNDSDFHRKTVFNEKYRRAHWQPLEIYLYPHNIFLNFWSELGLAGMLLFIWIIIKFYYLGIKNYLKIKKLKNKNSGTIKNNHLIIGLLGAMTVIIVHGLVDVPYFKNDLAVMFWIFIAMMGILDFSRKNVKIVE